MRYKRIWMLVMIGSFALFACNGNNDDSGASDGVGEVVVEFIDHGAVLPDPVSTTVTIDSDSIEYETEQSGEIVEQWSGTIDAEEYESLQLIIDDYNLLEMEDVTPEEGDICDGWGGMRISIDNDGSIYSFGIAGTVCSRDQWPEGVRALVDLRDELLVKYE